MVAWYYLALISAIFSAAAAIYQKKALFKEKVLAFTTALSIFNLILVFIFLPGISLSSLNSASLGILFIKSLLEAGAFICIMFSLKNLEISKALPMLVLTPGIVAIFAFILFEDSLTLLEILGMALLLIGTFMLETEGSFNPKKIVGNKGTKFIILALTLMVAKSLLDSTLLKGYNMPINSFMFFQHLFLALIFILAIIFLGKLKDIKSTFKNSSIIIFSVAIFTIIYRYTEFASIKNAPVALVLSLKRISVFFAVLIGGNMFKESNLLRRIIATSIMIAGAILVING